MNQIAPNEFDEEIGLNDITDPIPEGITKWFDPSLYRILAMPVRLRRISKGGIMLPDDSRVAAEWHHQLFKIVAVGGAVYKGKTYRDLDVDPETAPKVGDLWLIDPKQPRRFKFDGRTVLMVTDDQLLVRVHPDGVAHLSFYGLSL